MRRVLLLFCGLSIACFGCSKRESVNGYIPPAQSQFSQGSTCQHIVSNLHFNTIQIMSDPDCGYLGETIQIDDDVLKINNGIQAFEFRMEPQIIGTVKYYSLLSQDYLESQLSSSENGLVEFEVPRLYGGFGISDTSLSIIIDNQWYHIPKHPSGIFTFCYDGTNISFELSGVVLGNGYHECPFRATIRGYGKANFTSG